MQAEEKEAQQPGPSLLPVQGSSSNRAVWTLISYSSCFSTSQTLRTEELLQTVTVGLRL